MENVKAIFEIYIYLFILACIVTGLGITAGYILEKYYPQEEISDDSEINN